MERAELKRWVLGTGSAVERGDFVFLSDPQWGPAEREAFARCAEAAPRTDASRGWLCLPTGGTSGQVRFARHDEATIGAAVSGFCAHFGVTRVHALGLLPMHHVSGLMARVRCLATGGEYRSGEWKSLARGEWPDLGADRQGGPGPFISLVPTQLQRLLEQPGGGEFLKQFSVVLVGGGPTWAALDRDAADAAVPLALSYGMTETAAMMAAQRPSAFLRGERDAGPLLPHATVEIADEVTGQSCPSEVPGRIHVGGASLFRGYFPEEREGSAYATEDLGYRTAAGTLCILGRRDSVIITGGKKVWPAEVETVLRGTGAFADVAVMGAPDEHWGEAVVAFYPAEGLLRPLDLVQKALDENLATYKHPKRYQPLEPWPRNAQGKLNRATLRKFI